MPLGFQGDINGKRVLANNPRDDSRFVIKLWANTAAQTAETNAEKINDILIALRASGIIHFKADLKDDGESFQE